MKMATQTHLMRIGGIYYYRRRIPEDLIEAYSPKREIKFSLKTKDKRKAEQLARLESVRIDQEFLLHRAQLAQKNQVHSLSNDAITKLSQEFFHEALSIDDERRVDSEIDDGYLESISIANELFKESYANGLTGDIAFIVDHALKQHGLNVFKQSADYRKLTYEFIKAGLKSLKVIEQRQQGEVIDTPPPPPKLEATGSDSDSLEALRDYWLLQPTKKAGIKKSRTAIAEAATVIKKFREYVGDLKPSEVKKEHVVLLKDKMLEAGSSPATINKSRGILAAIFSCAESNAKIPTNPFYGMEKLAVPRGEVEKPYTVEELKAIFNSPIYTEGYRPTRFNGEASYWLPLLGLYTGARLSELGQIFTDDIGNEDEIDYIMIKPDVSSGRSVKDNKPKRIPIHSDLIKMGFLDYCRKIKEQGHKQLFPELKLSRKDGKLAEKWAEWWRDYVRDTIKVTRIPQPFHAFRHTFIAHGRRYSMDSDLRRIIEGHTPTGVDAKSYGDSLYPLAPLHKELEKLSFKGLDLSHLFKKD
jgi:integrase